MGKGMKLAVVLMLVAMAGLAGVASAENTVTLTWMAPGEASDPWNQHMIETFEAAYPHIRIEFQPQFSGWRDGGLTAQMIAGVGPDVLHGFGGFFREWIEHGFLQDLRPFLERDADIVDYDDFPPVFQQVFEVIDGPYKGIIGGMPFFVNQTLFQVNVGHFDEAGLMLPDDWTWDEFLDYGKKLTVHGVEDIERYGIDFVQLDAGWAPMWVWANGGVMFDWPENPTRFRLDEPVAVEALQWVQDAMHVLRVAHPDGNPDGTKSRGGFIAGRVPILNHGTAGFQSIDEAVGDTIERWDVMPRPLGKGGRGNRIALDGLGIWEGTKHPEEAWLFLRHVTSSEANKSLAELRGRQPARISAMPIYAEQYPYLTMHHIFNAMLEDPRIQPTETVVNANQVLPLINEALARSLIRNEVPAEVALREIADSVRSVYAQSADNQ